MDVLDEIREGFASLSNQGAVEIASLPSEYPAYVIRIPDGYGVAIEIDSETEVSEHFSSIRLYTIPLGISEKVKRYLVLQSAVEEYRYEFATMCAAFVDPGTNGSNRTMLLENPYKWWSRWKDMVGNASQEKSVYSVIAEMMALSSILERDKTAIWTASRMGTHDIECADESYEVKSTLKRYGASIVVSGQHQLECSNRLHLYFCRMEESLEGYSINDMKNVLLSQGYDAEKLELTLENMGLDRGANVRTRKYKALERRKYEIDSNFPRLTRESFKNDKIPEGITHIKYCVDLEGLPYVPW